MEGAIEGMREVAIVLASIFGKVFGVTALGFAMFFLIGAAMWKTLPADERATASQTAIAFILLAAVLLHFAPALPAR